MLYETKIFKFSSLDNAEFIQGKINIWLENAPIEKLLNIKSIYMDNVGKILYTIYYIKKNNNDNENILNSLTVWPTYLMHRIPLS